MRGTASGGWLWNGPADLLIGCAGWTLPWLALTGWLSGMAPLQVAFGFSLLALVCNQPHYAATLVRAFGSAAARRTHRRYAVHLTAVFAALLVAAFAWPPVVPLLFTAYVVWSPWHYTGQNFGLTMLLTRRRGGAPADAERQLLCWGCRASYGVWLLTVLHQSSDDPYLLSLAHLSPTAADALSRPLLGPLGLGDLAALFLACVFVVAVTMALTRLAARHGGRAVAPAALLLSSQGLWFIAPGGMELLSGQRLSPVYYATGALAFMHCAQYLWLTTAAARREAGAAPWRPGRYAGRLIVIGIALFTAGPWMASTLAGVDLREATLIFVALVNLHHFIVDGAIWKLRDPANAALLQSADRRPPAGQAPHDPAPRPILRPVLAGALAVALLAVAALAALQQYLTMEGSDPRRLALAQRLNPADRRIAVRRAEHLAAAGQPEAALRMLARDGALQPANATALRLTGQLLIATGQLDAAAAHYQAMRDRVGLDAGGLVNAGVLAARAERFAEATDAFRAALRLQPDLAAAHLNLAGVCLRRGDATCALAHYDAYLRAPQTARDRDWATAALNAASAAQLAGRPHLARDLLAVSATVAAQAGAADVLALARQRAAAHDVAPGRPPALARGASDMAPPDP